MTTAMQGGAIPPTETEADERADETVIDLSRSTGPVVAQATSTATPTSSVADAPPAAEGLWSPSLYGPRPDGAGPATSPDPGGAGGAAAAPTAVDVEALAAMAAEVAVSVARHREELAAAMAELTALQRTLRSEVRGVIAELDRIAAGVVADAPSTSDPGPAAVEAAPQRRGLLPTRLRRAH
jgi:hypothetical protein